ncbi:MAG: hypothetical protein QME94_07360 [Anaerolineae bacterium]|nr:hypothetical protein [Anaerolineae bacterium]
MERSGSPFSAGRAAYEIRVRGRLPESWSEWFEGLTVACEGEATILSGVVDQAALRAILCRLWDLHLVVLSVSSVGRSRAR